MKRIILANNTRGAGALLLATFLLYSAFSCQGQAPPGNGTNQVASSDYVCVQRGPDSKVWQMATFATNDSGDVTTNYTSYTELATGISYLLNGQYVDSVEQVEPVAGGAQAIQGRHQVQWANNANSPGGAVSVTTPNGLQLTSKVFGLAYYDIASGSNAALGQLKDCNGAIVAPNQVLYADAFTNVTADVLYTYTKAGLSQDILIDKCLPAPDAYGLSDTTTILQIYTSFINSPQPQVTDVTNGNVVDDSFINFGSMTMVPGEAIFLNGSTGSVSAGYVQKQWVNVSNSTYLIESVPYSSISNQLEQLPHASNLRPNRASIRHLAFLESAPSRPARPARNGPLMRLARANTAKPRLNIDYTLLAGTNNLVLRGDSTYLVTGLVNVTNTLTIEGGTVVKYTNSSSAEISCTNVVCLTAPYRPGVFTSMIDNSVGTVITNSTNAPSQINATYLSITVEVGQSLNLTNLRFSYASQGIYGNIIPGATASTVWDCQFLDCATAYYVNVISCPFTVDIYNVLFSRCSYALNVNSDGCLAISAVNVTADQVGTFQKNGLYICAATNCIFTSVTNLSLTASNDCSSASSGTGTYQTVGAGNYYLTNTSTNIANGTASIPSALLADLQTLTTEAPVVITNAWFTNSTNLFPQVERNTNTPDRGYHYPPIDWALNVAVSNATLTVQPGTVLAGFGTNGIYLAYNAALNCIGTAISPIWLVQYNTVQEQSSTSWASTNWYAMLQTPTANTGSSAICSFTDWSVLAGVGQIMGQSAECQFTAQNCQFYTGIINENGLQMASTNCLFVRPNFAVTDKAGNLSQTFFNNLFWQGELSLMHKNSGPYTFRDNFFDQTVITNPATIDYCSNNAYVTTNSGLLSPTNGDVILTNSPAYQNGALGDFYYPVSLTNLIHTGSRLASAAGLYHYTVTTNNLIEGTNIVSIGFHYVAVDANTNPLDSNGDGLPDYVKDSNGNGLWDPGTDLANWLSPFNIYDQGTSFEGWVPPYVRLSYWKFDTAALTNQAGLYPTSATTGAYPVPDWSSNAVSLTNSSSQLIYPISWNGTNYFSPGNGTISFWFRPNWSSTNSSAPSSFVFFEVQNTNYPYYWIMTGNAVNVSGSNVATAIYLSTGSNQYARSYSFNDGDGNGALASFQSNVWCQIVLTYSPTNVALYTNGVFLASPLMPPHVVATGAPIYTVGLGNVYYPPVSELDGGLCIGTQESISGGEAMGQFDEFQTFNSPLTAQQVAAGYPNFGGNATNMLDTYYAGRSDMLQTYVDGSPAPSPANVVPCRLGYWRFDSPLFYGEQGQVPISFSSVSQTPSWSGSALNVSSAASSQITYPDVGSNGWANVNCHQGSVRFWFRPNTTGGPGSNACFVYVGTTNGSDQWGLWLNSSGTTITFITESNNVAITNVTGIVSLTNTNQWTQIVLTYGTNRSSLYINSLPVEDDGYPVTNWPSLSNRKLGLVIGNTTAHNASINGQFEEMETFNYELSGTEISNNFQIVSSVDSDLDGIPDLLEDIHLLTARPFLGAPVVITGTIEAEQFDMGGPGIAYSNTVSNPPSTYRPTGMLISPVTNDTGGGYCLDQMRSNDWAKYSINVLVPQQYVIETRVAGIGTNGAFEVKFGTNQTSTYTNTGALTITSTNWSIVSTNVWLDQGTNVMTLLMLTDGETGGTLGTNVGRFNYISIYPWWQPGFISTNTNYVNMLYTNNDFAHALSNAVIIQSNVKSGQTVLITNGTYYVAQASPNETSNAWQNAAISILTNNVEIAGAGETNTTLIAYNRATTVFSLGESMGPGGLFQFAQCSNFILRDMTIEAQPHLAVSNGIGTNVTFELGQLALATSYYQGSIATFYGIGSSQFGYNILISNCTFLHGIKSLVPVGEVSNFMVVNCQFIPTDAKCLFTGTTNSGTNGTTNAWTSNTTNWQDGNVAIFGDGPFNAVVVSNIYIGNSSLITENTNVIGTNVVGGQTNILAPDGFVCFQTSGNVFVARNTISNNELEAVQLNAGPNAVVGNTFGTLVSDLSCCALNAYNGNQQGVLATNAGNYGACFTTCFIGNSVYGGRNGEEGGQSDGPFTINFSGNSLNLYLAFDSSSDYPGAAVNVARCQAANVCGNTLIAGGYGFYFSGTNAGALILNNNFSGPTYRGIGYLSVGDSLTTAQIFGNTLGQGVSFHAQLPYTNSFGWFIGSNTYVTNISTNVLFTDPASSAIHIYN